MNGERHICVIRVIRGSFEESSEPQIHTDDADGSAALISHSPDARYEPPSASPFCVIIERSLECDAASF